MVARARLRWFIKGIRFGAALFGLVGAAFVLVTMYWGSALISLWLKDGLPDWSWQVYWIAMFPFPGAILCFIIMYGLAHYKKWTMYPVLVFALAFPSIEANVLLWPIIPVIIGFFRHTLVKQIFSN
jgi:ABC-type Fe3+-siderophore transport system permease subunit